MVVVHWLSCSVACEIFQTRDQTHVPGIGRQIPSHCTSKGGWGGWGVGGQEVEKNNFIALSAKERHQASALKNCPSDLPSFLM